MSFLNQVMAVPLLALWAPDANGRTSGGLTAFGATAYTAIVLVVNLKVRGHAREATRLRDEVIVCSAAAIRWMRVNTLTFWKFDVCNLTQMFWNEVHLQMPVPNRCRW